MRWKSPLVIVVLAIALALVSKGQAQSVTTPVETAFASLGRNLVIAYGYDPASANPWKAYDPTAPSFASQLREVEPLGGYFVYVDQDVNFTVGPLSKRLKAGWNLVGWPGGVTTGPSLPPMPPALPRAILTPTPTATPSATTAMEQANQTFRSEVASALQEAAQQAGVAGLNIRTDDFVAIPLDDGSSVVVNTGITGMDTLNLEQLAPGADVLFTFLSLPSGSELPSGFYIVRVFRDIQTNQWRAQFKNMEGRVVLEKAAEVGAGDPALAKPKFTIKIECCPWKITLDLERAGFAVQIGGVALGTGDPDTTSLPLAGQKIVQAADRFSRSVNDALAEAALKTGKNIIDNSISGSRGTDLFVTHTVFKGVDNLTIEELANGQNVFFGYFRTPEGSGLPAGFYKVYIVQEAGRWLGRFVDDGGRVVYERPAVVTPEAPAVVTPTSGEPAGLVLTFNGGADSCTIDVHFDRLRIEVTFEW